jgi:hypothetical protein
MLSAGTLNQYIGELSVTGLGELSVTGLNELMGVIASKSAVLEKTD